MADTTMAIQNPMKVTTCPAFIPMKLLNEEWARHNHDQSLATLNRRGGLSPCEALAIIERRPWHRMDDAQAVRKLLDYASDAAAEPPA